MTPPNPEETATPMTTIASIRKIKDPMDRVKAAQALVEEAQIKGDEARRTRDMAAMYLDLVLRWRPTQIVNQIGVSRSLYVRIRDRFPTALIEKVKTMEGDVPAIAAESGAQAAEWDALADEAIAVRDAAIEAAINSGVRNADVARATGLSTARIAQIRTGN